MKAVRCRGPEVDRGGASQWRRGCASAKCGRAAASSGCSAGYVTCGHLQRANPKCSAASRCSLLPESVHLGRAPSPRSQRRRICNLCKAHAGRGQLSGVRAARVLRWVVCSFYARSGALSTLAGTAWAGCERLPGGSALHWPALTSSSPEHVQHD